MSYVSKVMIDHGYGVRKSGESRGVLKVLIESIFREGNGSK